MPANLVIGLNHNIPAWSNYARGVGEAIHPFLHRGLTNAWIPGLGPTGNKLFDICGQKRHGSLENMDPSSDWVQSEIGRVLDFDGSTDYVDLGDWVVRNPTLKQMSMSVWTKLRSYSPTDARIISKATGTSSADHWWMISYVSTERWRIRLKAGGSTITVSESVNNTIDLDVWYNLGFTYNGRYIYLYRDGRRIGSSTYAKTGDLAEGAGIGINLARNPDGYGEMNGQIGPVMIWNRALTEAEFEVVGRDPYALVRRRPELVVKVAAAAPSPLFPPFPPKQNTLLRM